MVQEVDVLARFPNQTKSKSYSIFILPGWFPREVAYAVIFSCITWLIPASGHMLLSLWMPLSLLSWLRGYHLWQFRIGIGVLISTGAIGPFVYFVWLILTGILDVSLLKKAIPGFVFFFVLFVLYSASSNAVNLLVELNFLAFPAWVVSFVSPLGVFLYFSSHPLAEKSMWKVCVFLLVSALIQCLIAYVSYIHDVGFTAIWHLQASPDGVVGTFPLVGSGFSIFLLNAIVLLLLLWMTSGKKQFSLLPLWFCIGVLGIFVFTADDKAIELSFLAAIALFLVLVKKIRLKDRPFRMLVYGLLVMIVLLPFIHRTIERKLYILAVSYISADIAWSAGALNRKLLFYSNALDVYHRGWLRYLVGYGPGTCGSRAANMRAYDTLYKGKNSAARVLIGKVPAYSSDCTKRFLAPLYDEEYASTASGRSAVLGNPFAAWPALLLEGGVIGLGIFLSFVFSVLWYCRSVFRDAYGHHFRRAFAGVAAVNLAAMCIFSLVAQGFENPYFTFFLFFALAMTFNTSNTHNKR